MKARSRIYWRERGGERRAYADFRDMGGGREALIAEGDTRATTDPVIAETLVAARLAELQERKRDRVLTGIQERASLKTFVAHHLVQKAKAGKVTETHLANSERILRLAIEHFGDERDLASIGVGDVQGWVNALSARAGRRGGRLSAGSLHEYLSVLSNVYKRAQSEGRVTPGFNPVAAMMDKPTSKPEEARWLEVHDAALLLESARMYTSERKDRGLPFIHALLATYLLTGGRETEVLGLEVQDINFERRTVTFRPNEWRRLKTRTSHRSVQLWPQLERILRDYLRESGRVGGLLFPSPRLNDDTGANVMVTDFRWALDAIAERVGWKAGEIRSKMFRHTYTAARLQTLDNSAPVSIYTVGRELGHGGEALVKRVYGHLGEVRHRAEVVEFRVEQHKKKLGTKLQLLRAAQSA